MSKNTKIFLQFMIAAVLFLSLAVTSCNNSGDKKEEAPVSTEKQMEAAPAAPAVPDTTKRDTAATRPTPGGA